MPCIYGTKREECAVTSLVMPILQKAYESSDRIALEKAVEVLAELCKRCPHMFSSGPHNSQGECGG
jgi:hypothetical protein